MKILKDKGKITIRRVHRVSTPKVEFRIKRLNFYFSPDAVTVDVLDKRLSWNDDEDGGASFEGEGTKYMDDPKSTDNGTAEDLVMQVNSKNL